jgi:hypothetical protein
MSLRSVTSTDLKNTQTTHKPSGAHNIIPEFQLILPKTDRKTPLRIPTTTATTSTKTHNTHRNSQNRTEPQRQSRLRHQEPPYLLQHLVDVDLVRLHALLRPLLLPLALRVRLYLLLRLLHHRLLLRLRLPGLLLLCRLRGHLCKPKLDRMKIQTAPLNTPKLPRQ